MQNKPAPYPSRCHTTNEQTKNKQLLKIHLARIQLSAQNIALSSLAEYEGYHKMPANEFFFKGTYLFKTLKWMDEFNRSASLTTLHTCLLITIIAISVNCEE